MIRSPILSNFLQIGKNFSEIGNKTSFSPPKTVQSFPISSKLERISYFRSKSTNHATAISFFSTGRHADRRRTKHNSFTSCADLHRRRSGTPAVQNLSRRDSLPHSRHCGEPTRRAHRSERLSPLRRRHRLRKSGPALSHLGQQRRHLEPRIRIGGRRRRERQQDLRIWRCCHRSRPR